MPQREGEEMQAMLEKFKEEMKKGMLELVEKALSAKAAASPAAGAAPGDGGASGQSLAERMAGLEATVVALKQTNTELQKLYQGSFYKGRESESEISKLKKKIEEMQDHRRSVPPVASPFGTPVQVPAWIPLTSFQCPL